MVQASGISGTAKLFSGGQQHLRKFRLRAAEKKSWWKSTTSVLSVWPFHNASMAKGKEKSSTGANAVPVADSKSAGESFPQLEEGAFAGLRQKIEQKLKNEQAAKQHKSKNKKTQNVDKSTPKKEKEAAPKSEPKREIKSDKNNKGKKRDRNGEVIAREEKKAGGNQDDTLRQEILALGGTEEDFDLLAGVESESEVEVASETQKKSKNKSDDDSLRKELSAMLSAAGQVVPDDIEDENEVTGASDSEGADEEEEQEEEEDDAQQSEDSDQSEEKEEAFSAPVARKTELPKKEKAKGPVPENIFPKEFSKLVSVSESYL
jgi:ribosome biogenesis protein MAK21